MSILAIATICGFLYSPAAGWDSIPLPATSQVIEIPFSQIDRRCNFTSTSRTTEFACTYQSTLIAFVPTWKTWPGTRQCWEEVRRHEEAHLKGYIHP